MVDGPQNSIKIIREAYSDAFITKEELQNIETAVLADKKIDDAEVQALGKLLEISSFEPLLDTESLPQFFIQRLATSRTIDDYQAYQPFYQNFYQQDSKRIFWSYQNPEFGAKLDVEGDGGISIQDVLSYKHPHAQSKPDCARHLSPQGEIPFDFAYPQWNSLVHFLRGKILEGPESMQSVREFMVGVYQADATRFESLLDAFNVHVEPTLSKYNNADLAIMAIETSIARVVGAENFSQIFDVPLNSEDFEIPLYIQPRPEEENDHWAAMTSSGMLNGAHRVYITLFSDQETLREKSDSVQHEMRHALTNRILGREHWNELPLLVREPLAAYWNQGDGKIEMRLSLANAHFALEANYIPKIYETLRKNEHEGKVFDEHFDGNVFFYFLERHYGPEALKRFCHAIITEAHTPGSFLEKAAQAMASKTWREVLEDFKAEAPRYLTELKHEEGGKAFEAVIQDYFHLSYADWYHANKVNELRQMPAERRLELKIKLSEILQEHPNSVYKGHISYLLGQIEMFEGNFKQARAHFLQVDNFQSSTASYGVIWSYVMEGNLDLALHLTQQQDLQNPRFSRALEDISKYQGEALRARYFNFYFNPTQGEIPYSLDEA